MNDVYGPVQERVLAIEDVPLEMPQKQAMDAAYPVIPSAMFSKVKGIGSIYSPEDEFYQSARIPSWNQSMPTTSVPPNANNMTTEEIVQALRPSGKTRNLSSVENVADEPKAISQSMNPMQDDWGDIQRPKGFVEKYGKYVPNVFAKAAVKGYGYVEDKKWSNMSPEERLAQLSRGVRPTGAPSGMGQDNDRGEEFRPPSSRANESTTGTRTPKPKGNGPRPAIYYKWDLGVDVPSPTDSDYTLYTKYLQEKAAARAGFA